MHEHLIGFDDRARVERKVPASVQRRERRATARRMKPTKKASVASAFLDAFADIIADRVAMKLGEASPTSAVVGTCRALVVRPVW